MLLPGYDITAQVFELGRTAKSNEAKQRLIEEVVTQYKADEHYRKGKMRQDTTHYLEDGKEPEKTGFTTSYEYDGKSERVVSETQVNDAGDVVKEVRYTYNYRGIPKTKEEISQRDDEFSFKKQRIFKYDKKKEDYVLVKEAYIPSNGRTKRGDLVEF